MYSVTYCSIAWNSKKLEMYAHQKRTGYIYYMHGYQVILGIHFKMRLFILN